VKVKVERGGAEKRVSLSFCGSASPMGRAGCYPGGYNARCVFVPQKPLVSPCGALFIRRMNLG